MLVWLHVFLVRLQGKIRDERFLAPLVSMYNLPPRDSNSFCKIRWIGDFYCQENHLTNGSGSFESTTDAVDVTLSRMFSRLPFFNHNAIESSTSSANAETASMTDASNLDVGG